MGRSTLEPGVEHVAHADRARHALADARHHLKRRAFELVGFLLVVYVVLKLIPAFEQALNTLEHASWQWLLALVGLEVLSETGFVFSWSAIVDADDTLAGEGRGRRTADDVAWAQLGSGLLLPGGAWGGMGWGALILRRFGMPGELIAKRQLTLSFLNTAIAALALVLFGVGLGAGVLSGESNALLTLLPAGLAVVGIAAALFIASRIGGRGKPTGSKHGKLAGAVTDLAVAVEETKRLLVHRGAWVPVLGAIAYFGFDVLVLWLAFLAVHANPVPAFPIVIMAYIIGGLGGSIPLPAAAGSIGGMAGMLIVYGVPHYVALAAVLLHQAIALLVPLTGGSIAQASLRRRLGPLHLLHGQGDASGSD
jgi:uncharacterized membrane protein YbhN (UPF0104 family)